MHILLLLAGCGNTEADSGVAAACDAAYYGYACPSADAMVALDQINSYRALMGLSEITLEPRLDTAAQAHADYMLTNDALTHQESSSASGFTGEWVWDRIEAEGYPLEQGRVWMEVISYGLDPAGAIDGWIGTVYHRIPFTTPEVLEVGFGQAADYSALAIVVPFPDIERRAVLYPADGQTDVPRSFDSDTESPDPAPSHGTVGYPISVSVAAPIGMVSLDNPYALELLSAEVVGPDGALELLLLDPSTDKTMFNMAAVMPVEPLEGGTTYTVSMTVTYGGEEETLTGSFVTSAQ